MNYSAVAPPSQPGSSEPQSAFADALARARQIAAKINQPTEESANPLKRAFDDSFPEEQAAPDNKKLASGEAIGNQLRAIADQQRASQAAQAAAAAASQINAKLGRQSSSSSGNMDAGMGMSMGDPGMGGMGGGPHAGLGGGMMTSEDYSVPDRMVGLIIGKGGEQIANIQSETGCKVQFAPDSAGMPDRPCQLMGTPQAIAEAKKTIERIIQKGQGLPDNFGGDQTMLEVFIPGNKVGLVIGKGGETIKHLQEQAGVKMVMIQDSNLPSNQDKPLRITGSIQACQKAKELVMDLIAEKDMGGGGGGGGGYGGDYGGGGRNAMEIPVPRSMVGVVIGRGGEMIKKIQAETGAKVQFKTDDGQGPNRMCTINGPQDKVQNASCMIRELIDTAMNDRGRGRGGGGRGGGMDFNGGSGGNGRDYGNGGGGGGSYGGGGSGQDETMFAVPAEKCGLVIGKGGETIREINRQSGAHVELDRHQSQSNSRDRVFKIQGNADQIQSAIRLISDKASISPTSGGAGPQGGYGGEQGGFGGFGGYGNQPMQNQQFGGPQGGQGGPPQQQFNAPQGWGGSSFGQQWNQSNPQDPRAERQSGQSEDGLPKQADANAQAWQAYYQQLYGSNQPGAPQGGAPGANGQAQPNPQQGPPAGGQQPAPAINPQTGQPDYSAAWAEYYRSQGMHYHAQAILQQQQQQGGTPQPPQ